ncbi:thiolase family protein [Nocardioides daphniae]|uniref:Probable acetyl-CoA acetyltransferase n=1 Tax=Nocardioides daphniae TaxID=402297 RepID=A0A4P7UGP4_9ACTN|nr:thiolase family protein [Nocardioides daphniae]QCC78511.1 thiolase family protein [Nocardioides daphniae]GGD11798.1 acetyl-CoA acetyltransferase [Nocardioides daphniae]
MSDPVIISAVRTPIGTAKHSLRDLTVEQLAGPVVAAAVRRTGLDAATVHDVVLGNCLGPGGNVARVSALAAGLPDTVPGLTVDRQCASGLAAIDLSAQLVRSGAGLVVAGGVESASTAPWRFWPPVGDAEPVRYERAPFAPTAADDLDMGLSNDLLAAEAGVTRARQDAYAARSHALAVAAQQRGAFADELLTVAGVDRDDRPRAGLTPERLARLRPAFREGGTVTAGNSCGISDGAAAVAVVPAETQQRLGVPGLRILATATSGVSPTRPGVGLVPATRLALQRAGLTLDQVDVIELNEAFAGQVLACCDELELDPDRVCREGGALALGHPWGASGAVLMVRLFTQLVTRGQGRHGLAAIAAGGGMGVAAVVERIP